MADPIPNKWLTLFTDTRARALQDEDKSAVRRPSTGSLLARWAFLIVIALLALSAQWGESGWPGAAWLGSGLVLLLAAWLLPFPGRTSLRPAKTTSVTFALFLLLGIPLFGARVAAVLAGIVCAA
jgi:hypothetical protein